MNKAERLKYMRENWGKDTEDETVFVPRDVADAIHPLDELHQLDKRAENGIISDAD